MITPGEIKKKADRQFADFLRSAIAQSPFFPLTFPIGRAPQSYPDLQKAVTKLIHASKEKIGFGYTLVLTTKNTRKHGPQSLPDSITIDSEADYLKLLDKETIFTHFIADVALIQSAIPALSEWIQHSPLKVVEHHTSWPDLIKVCQYFQQNPQPNLYIRELPIAVHTKFIEEHKEILRSLLEEIILPDQLGIVENNRHTFEQRFSLRYREPLLSLRILDDSLQKAHGFPLAEFSAALSDFATLQVGNPICFITENVMPFLTFPPLEQSIAIWGAGYAVNALRSIHWLQDCPIYYWGDLDVEGFDILSQVRSHFPQTQSILMDTATYNTFEHFTVTNDKPITPAPERLTPEETALYTHLSNNQQRLEQERISQPYVNRFLETTISQCTHHRH